MNSVCLLLESSTTVGSRSWDLDTLGNWLQTGFDLTGDGDFGDTDEVQDRTHNLANELLTASKTFEPFGSTLTYDPSGNLKQDKRTIPGTPLPVQYDINYVHDAWNRLISVTRQPGSLLRGSYEYNGLNWRTLRRYDSGPTQQTAVDDERIYYYSAAWQVLEEHVDEGFATSAGTDRIVQQVWGVRYIDDAVLRRVDRNADGDFADGGDGIFFMATDVQFSVVAVLDDAGVLHERVAYSPYGRGEHRWGGDVNGDGSVDNYDLLAIATAAGEAIGDAGYQADLDVDRDGTILPTGVTEDLVRVQAFGSRVAVPTGWISDPADTAGPDNEVGYAGYRFNCEDQMYCVRFRHYSPRLGRWMQRDPAGYVDGMGLYEYVRSSPIQLLDPLGRQSEEAQKICVCVLDLEACTEAQAKRTKLNRIEKIIVEACEESDPAVAAIRDGWAIWGVMVLEDGVEQLGDQLEKGARDASRMAIREADHQRRIGHMLNSAREQLAARQAAIVGIGGKCLKAAGSAFDVKQIIDGLRRGDALEVVGGGSSILINFLPGGAVVGVLGGIGAGTIEAVYDHRARKESSRRHPGRCEFFKSLRYDVEQQVEAMENECREAMIVALTIALSGG